MLNKIRKLYNSLIAFLSINITRSVYLLTYLISINVALNLSNIDKMYLRFFNIKPVLIIRYYQNVMQ